MKRGSLLFAVLVLVGCGGSGPDGTGGGNGGGTGGASGGGSGGGGGAAACSATNCTGCCLNGTCQAGSTAAGCGKNGAVCLACINGAICKTDQTCGIDPNSMWKVQPASATITPLNAGADWDFGGGAPDPFVQLTCPATSTTVTTSTAAPADTFNPTWTTTSGAGCVMSASQLMTTGFKMILWDEDVSSNDAITGNMIVKPTEGHLIDGFVSFNAAGEILALRVNLTKQ